jgi:hypothetical protein
MDVHDRNARSYDLALSAGECRAEIELQVKALASERNHGGHRLSPASLEYDMSIRYVDREIGRLLNVLSEKGSLDNTLVVLTSDHGSRDACAASGMLMEVDSFNETLYHCPLLFHGHGLAPAVHDHLCSALDFSPTLLRLAGLDVPLAFHGSSQFARAESARSGEPVLMEHLGRGPCDFLNKLIRICAMDKEHRLVYGYSLRDNTGEVIEIRRRKDDVQLDKDDIPGDARELLRAAKQRVEILVGNLEPV